MDQKSYINTGFCPCLYTELPYETRTYILLYENTVFDKAFRYRSSWAWVINGVTPLAESLH